MTGKHCGSCDRHLGEESFYRNRSRRDGLTSQCRDCCRRSSRNVHLKNRYGIDESAYAEMLDRQGGGCAACGGAEETGIGGQDPKLAVDHCHLTGEIRGLLCRNCNSSIGMVGDCVLRVALLLAYLTNHHLKREGK